MSAHDNSDRWVDPDFERSVRDTAYFLWEHDGRPMGREQEYWFAALERCLRQRQADQLLTVAPINDEEQGGDDGNGR